MTESTGLPAARPRKILTQIAPVAWEHPADRAALQSLRAVPGFDEVVKKIYGFIGERGVRLLFQADSVRVGPTQFPRLNQLYTEVLTTMDWADRPELFVSQTPFVNAGAFGMERPFIVINSGALKLLDDAEMRALLGHELGHVMSGHALYRTILILILSVSFASLPFLAGIALLPIRIALLEWYRKSELSSDRAGLLAIQDPTPALDREQPRAVRRQLALAVPLEQRDADRQQRDPREEGQGGEAHAQDEDQDGAVERVAAHHVAQLVAQQGPHLGV